MSSLVDKSNNKNHSPSRQNLLDFEFEDSKNEAERLD